LLFFSSPIVDSKDDRFQFIIGEKLTYSIECLGIRAGIATFEIKKIVDIDGKKYYYIIATAKSVGLFSRFYRVNDKLESYIDVETGLPFIFKKHQEEGSHRKDLEICFNQKTHRAKLNKKQEVDILPEMHDPISAFYFLRALVIKYGSKITVNATDSGKSYQVEVKVLKGEKTIRGNKRFKTILFKPSLKNIKFEGILKKNADVSVWMSEDKRRLPLIIKIKVRFGVARIKLIEDSLGVIKKTKWKPYGRGRRR
jgi:hypothetical protein